MSTGINRSFLIMIFVSFILILPHLQGISEASDDNSSIMTVLVIPGSDPVIEPALKDLPSSKTVKVWIYFTDKGIFAHRGLQTALDDARSALTERALARRTRTRPDNLVDFRDIPINGSYITGIETAGAQVKHRIRWMNAVSAVVRVSDLDRLASMNFVRKIERVKRLGRWIDDIKEDKSRPESPGSNLDYTYGYGDSEPQLRQINVPPAHELGFDGTDVLVCMLDTGYRKGHEAFAPIINSGRLITEWDFINNDGETDWEQGDPEGQADHGTYTWSALGGENDGNLYGPAFNAYFVLGKTEAIDFERHVEEDWWAAGAEWADSIGADVISSSLGYRWFDPGQGDYEYSDLDGNTTIVTIAADLAVYNGITVCTAMGNEGYQGAGSLIAPADGDSVIGVGAIDSDGNIAWFSSLGPTYDDRIKPEVNARGVNTRCADPNNMNGYRAVGGTSLSTPLAGGASAVVLSAHPHWTPVQVREALMMTADRSDNPDNTYGWGTVNATHAIFYNPEGSIVFDFAPLNFAWPDQQIPVEATITCSEGLNQSSVTLYWNDDGSANYNAVPMSNNGDLFTASIPAHSAGDSIFYYIYAEKNNGLSEVYPCGAPRLRFEMQVSMPHFADNFENGPYKWIIGGDHSEWGITASEANSGKLSFTDSPRGNYGNNVDNWMVLRRPLDFSDAENIELSFYHYYNLQSGYDNVYIEGSTDNGNTWIAVGDPITGTNNQFTETSHSLEQFAGAGSFLLRFRISTNSSTTRDGWYVDDLTITFDTVLPDVRISMIPDNYPINVPRGGSFTYTGILANATAQSQIGDVWLMLRLPNGNQYGPLNRYNNVHLQPRQVISISGIVQDIPGYAPLGTYSYISRCGHYPNTVEDSFSFDFTVIGGREGISVDWSNSGWYKLDDNRLPVSTVLKGNYPNPFNASTNISFAIPETDRVKLEVFNLGGQLVETLVDGRLDGGEHVIDWDASTFSSGIYFYRLESREGIFTGRMILLK